MTPDTPNGRVTLAVLGEKMDNFESLLQSIRVEVKVGADDREMRLRCLENIRFPSIENRVGRVEERQGAFAVGQGIFTTIAAVIAGWVGSRQ